jgi:YD repeat-containing protein
MTRGNVTQTRTYLYSGSDLISSTNPENGTVTYTYDTAHHVLTRTDALGQQTQYTYDGYGRMTEAQYYPYTSNGTEDVAERVNYYYDNNLPPLYGSNNPFQGSQMNGIGLLTGVGFGGGSRMNSAPIAMPMRTCITRRAA